MAQTLLPIACFLAAAEAVGNFVNRAAVVRQFIGGAMAEGLALVAAVIYFTTGATEALGLAAVALTVLIFQFPNAARVQRFADLLRK